MRTKNQIILFICIALLLSYSNVRGDEKIPYGVITGEKVNLRVSPSAASKVVYQFITKDIVFYLEKSEKEERINNESYYWYKVRTQKKMTGSVTGWVYGKYFKLLDDKASVEEKILKELIDQEFYDQLHRGPTYYYNPKLQIISFNEKHYYIFSYHARDDEEHQNYGNKIIFIKDLVKNKFVSLRGTGNDYSYHFYDLDNDGYAEIIMYRDEYKRGIALYGEKQNKDIFNYVLPFQTFYKGKRINDSYVELKEIEPGKKCEIVVHIQEDKTRPIKEIVYRWNGKTFAADGK